MKYTTQIIQTSKLKRTTKGAGKRISADAVMLLDRHVHGLIMAATRTHNGGRKTIDATVMAMVCGAVR